MLWNIAVGSGIFCSSQRFALVYLLYFLTAIFVSAVVHWLDLGYVDGAWICIWKGGIIIHFVVHFFVQRGKGGFRESNFLFWKISHMC